MAVILRDGMDGLTIAKVAKEADAAVGALYRYFPSKDELLTALQERAVLSYATFMRRAIDDVHGKDHPLQGLRAMVQSWFAYADAEPELHTLIDASMSAPHATLSTESARKVDTTIRELVFSAVYEVLIAGELTGQLQPGDHAVRAMSLWVIAHGTTQFRKRDRLGTSPSTDEVREELVGALLASWAS